MMNHLNCTVEVVLLFSDATSKNDILIYLKIIRTIVGNVKKSLYFWSDKKYLDKKEWNMKTIFVIGNGFDLAHGLKTSYGHFMDSIDTKNTSNKLLKLLASKHTDKWSDIEYLYYNLLLHYNDFEYITKEFTNYEGDDFGNSKELDKNFEEIKEFLQNYLQNEQKNLKLIDTYSKLFTAFNDKSTLILDFNYTDTIYKYINGTGSLSQHIKIHGELMSVDNPIVFGYAANDEEAKILSYKNDEYLMKNIKKLRYLLSDNEINLKEILEKSDNKIDVYILGHSCGLSDRLILHELFTHKKVKGITPFYFGEMEGFLNTVINIDRVIDDYTKIDKKERSFSKLKNFKECSAMLQHNSVNTNIEKFSKFVNLIKTEHNNKQSNIGMLSSFL
jgi:hypothetical protein